MTKEAFREDLTSTYWDLIILGATVAGIFAAYRAKMAGMSKILIVEPTRYIGGMTCQAGIQPLDIAVGSQIGGLTWQVTQRVKALEGLADSASQPGLGSASSTPGNVGYNPLTNPGFAWTYASNWEAELTRVLQQSGATLVLDAPLDPVAGNQWAAVGFYGRKIVSIRTKQGTFRGAQFSDGDYEGDLLIACAKQGLATLSVGQESSAKYGESMAGAGYNQVTQVATGQDLTSGGAPLYPLIRNPGRIAGSASDEIMAYSMRHKLRLIADGNAQAFTPPPGYDPTKFAAMGKLLTALAASVMPVTLKALNGSPGAQDVNNNGSLAISNDLPNKSKGYPLGSPAQRQAIIDEHYHWGQGLFYYCQTDAAVPSAVRAHTALYGFAKDHWADNRYQPRRMYIREGVRMVGRAVLTQGLIDAVTPFPDPIGKGSYPFDGHGPLVYLDGTNSIVTDSGSFGADKTYRLPMGMVVPQVGEVENLTVPVCCSCSRVAWLSVRMELTFAQLGEASGAINAAAWRLGIPTWAVTYAHIQGQLSNVRTVVS